MTLHQFMNLTVAEIKEKKIELAKELEKASTSELAGRLVLTLLDAKTRDEKLGEQGKTITALQQGNEALTDKVSQLTAKLTKTEKNLAEVTVANENLTKTSAEVERDLTAKLQAEMARADTGETLARKRRVALAEIMTHISPLLVVE